MKSVIVGTAGHIDHGKTSLVKALTGIDADRLEEEKRRGITIDIGFAHLELPGVRLGFVDVPGHERFVRNMLAGIGGIDLVLLVVAADEGIKPQTREHFDICRLLGVRRGMTVLTKADLVDRETLEVVRLEVEEFLRGSFLDAAHAPIVAASATTGRGMEDVKRELARLAAEVPAKDSSALFRLPIDRVFSMKGFGTVVTGTLISGAVAREEEVEVFPSGQRARVRGVQVHDQAVERALAGQRTALNLAGIEKDQLARGMTLAAPGLFRPTQRIDVSLSLLPSARPLKDRSRVHFHAYTVEMAAEVHVLGGEKELRPGESAYAQLRLAQPTLLLPGDHFILRQFSPVVTIGGGAVIDAAAKDPKKLFRDWLDPQIRARKAFGEAVETNQAHVRELWDRMYLNHLRMLTSAPDERILLGRLQHPLDYPTALHGLTVDGVTALTGWTAGRVKAVAEKALTPLALMEPPDDTGVYFFESRPVQVGDIFFSSGVVFILSQSIRAAMMEYHNANPLSPGMNREELRKRVEAPPLIFGAVLDLLVNAGRLELLADVVRQSGRGAQLKDEESESKEMIERGFATAGLKVPALKDVLASLKVDRARAQKIVTLLLRDRVLVKLADDLVFHRDALEQLRALIREQKAKTPQMDVARFKELTGVSRKYAIPLLEWLDRERVTRRVGDTRVIL